MIYYHGSIDGNIKEFNISNRKLYITTSRLVALTYISKSFPNMFKTAEDGRECYIDIVDGLYEAVTKKQSGYIYTLDVDDAIEVLQDNNCGHKHCYYSISNVKILKKEKVEDLYQELLFFEEKGEFFIKRANEISEENRKRAIQSICKTYEGLKKPLKGKRDFMYLLIPNKQH